MKHTIHEYSFILKFCNRMYKRDSLIQLISVKILFHNIVIQKLCLYMFFFLQVYIIHTPIKSESCIMFSYYVFFHTIILYYKVAFILYLMENAFKDNECGLIQLGWGYVFVVVWVFFSMFCANHIKMLLKSCKLHVYLFSLT